MFRLTYLEIVNKVLRKLREDTVTTVDYSDYSALIGEFVNDAKREVENAYRWSAHRGPLTFTSNGARNYSIYEEGSLPVTSANGLYAGPRATLQRDANGNAQVYDITDLGGSSGGVRMLEIGHEEYTRWFNEGAFNSSNTEPSYFSFTNANGEGYIVWFDGFPTDRIYQLFFYLEQLDLVDNTDILMAPWSPVVNLAVLYALDERGEEIGEPGAKAWRRYETSLADAIALDSMFNPDKAQFLVK